ncbi:MAG: BatD family protein [Ignavibacteriaceae bacterium]
MRFYQFLLIPLILTIQISPQSFTASASQNKVGQKDNFEITFTFEGKDLNQLTDFTPPDLKNFVILSGPNLSTSMQIINGSMSASKSYSYYLQAKKTGRFTIGSASVKYGSEIYKTQPIEIEVVQGSLKQGQQSAKNEISTEEIEKNLFITAVADKQKVYLGEQLTVEYKLYTRLDIATQMAVNKLPQYQGLWSEELKTSSNISFTTETIDGKPFRVGTLKKVALFPNQTGRLEVTPLEIVVPVRIQTKSRSNSFFDQFFADPFGRSEIFEYTAKSNTLRLDVKPLPEEHKPANFSGAVGNYSISASIDKRNLKTNEPVNFKVTISGTGNIQLLQLPEIKFPAGFESYEPKTSVSINNSGRISGSKSFEYLIIPRITGEEVIPPVNFSFFNPSKQEYVTVSTDAITINIEKGSEPTESYLAGKEDIKILGQDIRFIKTGNTGLSRKRDIVLFQFGFWAAVLLPVIVLTGLVIWKNQNEKLQSNQQLLKYRKAEKIARNRFRRAAKLLDENLEKEFYNEITQAINGYLEDKLQLSKADFTIEKAAEILAARNVNPDLITELKQNAEKCELYRFAPGMDGKTAMKDMYNNLSNVIIEIEKQLPGKSNV